MQDFQNRSAKIRKHRCFCNCDTLGKFTLVNEPKILTCTCTVQERAVSVLGYHSKDAKMRVRLRLVRCFCLMLLQCQIIKLILYYFVCHSQGTFVACLEWIISRTCHCICQKLLLKLIESIWIFFHEKIVSRLNI